MTVTSVAPRLRVPRSTSPFMTVTSDKRQQTRTSMDPSAAIGIISELKSNAALFAAFAFGGLALPSTLTVSESKVTSVASSLSQVRPNYAIPLLKTYVVLDTFTLASFISCVAISQLLIYQLADGSYGTAVSENDNDERSDSPLYILVNQYGYEFAACRTTFALGLTTLLLGVGTRVLSVFNESIAIPSVSILLTAACAILYFYVRTQARAFGPLQEDSFSNLPIWVGVVGALGLVVATATGLVVPDDVIMGVESAAATAAATMTTPQ